MMKTFREYLKESVLDTVQPTYSPVVFDKPYEDKPVIKDSIKQQIFDTINEFRKVAPIFQVYVIGGILTRQYNEFSDIDVNLLFDVNPNNAEAIKKILNEINHKITGQYAHGTTHPINYYVIVDPAIFDRANSYADNVYNLFTDEYIKHTLVSPINVEDYYTGYRDTIHKLDFLKAELHNELIHYDHLKNIPTGDIKNLNVLLKRQYNKVLADLKNFVEYGNTLIQSRRDIYTKEMTPDEVVKYGVHNKLPQNIIYKMLEKHYYLNLIHKLEQKLAEVPPLPYKQIIKLLA